MIVEGHAPSDDAAVEPLAVLLYQREHLRRLSGNEVAHLLGELFLAALGLLISR
ncbi:MAG: hypothetical protein ACRDRP_01410 [Pseudonocardiaceae bacterium]